jgi:predicted Zn-dependent protease with MMP-like domain
VSSRVDRLERYRQASRHGRLRGRHFAALVLEAVEGLPAEFRKKIDNVALVIEERPSPGLLESLGMGPGQTLLGLYQGIPLASRSSGYSMVPPDRITIFREPILERCSDDEQVRREVQATVLHELGHYFGLGHRDLR